MDRKEEKDNLTDLIEALPSIGNDPTIPPGTVRAEDGTIVTLGKKPSDGWLLSLIRKASNQGKGPQ